jgi:hypothetical protein
VSLSYSDRQRLAEAARQPAPMAADAPNRFAVGLDLGRQVDPLGPGPFAVALRPAAQAGGLRSGASARPASL